MAQLETYTIDPTINDNDTWIGADSANSDVTRRFKAEDVSDYVRNNIVLSDTGITATLAEVNILDGATITTTELNALDGITATATELNVLDGIVSSTTQLNYLRDVSSNVQDQLDGKQATLTGATSNLTSSNLAINSPLVSDGSGKIIVSPTVNLTEFNYLEGVTSGIQGQIDDLVEFEPSNTGTANQILQRTATGYQWADADEASFTLNAATNSTLGGVIIQDSSDLSVDSTGNLTLKNISANKITSGVLNIGRLSSDTPTDNQVLTYNGTSAVWEDPSGSGSGHTILGQGSEFMQRTNLDFRSPLTVTDNSADDSTEVSLTLTASDIPNLPAGKITSGTFNRLRLTEDTPTDGQVLSWDDDNESMEWINRSSTDDASDLTQGLLDYERLSDDDPTGGEVLTWNADGTMTWTSKGSATVTKESVDTAIGAGSSGDEDKFYNEQGDFIEVVSTNVPDAPDATDDSDTIYHLRVRDTDTDAAVAEVVTITWSDVPDEDGDVRSLIFFPVEGSSVTIGSTEITIVADETDSAYATRLAGIINDNVDFVNAVAGTNDVEVTWDDTGDTTGVTAPNLLIGGIVIQNVHTVTVDTEGQDAGITTERTWVEDQSAEVSIGGTRLDEVDFINGNTAGEIDFTNTSGDVTAKVHSRTSSSVDATDGYVLTADGSGGVAWELAPGAGGSGSEVTVNGGSQIAEADFDTYTVAGGTTIAEAGGNITIRVHSRTSSIDNATDGHVLTADGSGGLAWEASPSGHTIQDDGTAVTTRGNLNFVAPITVTDDSDDDSTNIGLSLLSSDVPDLPASKITTGKFNPVDRISATSVTDGYVLTADGAGNVAWEVIPTQTNTVDVVSNVTSQRILGRNTSGSGDSEELTGSQVRSILSLGDLATRDNITTSQINGSVLAVASEASLNSDSTLPTTAWVKAQGYTTGGIFNTIEDSDGTAITGIDTLKEGNGVVFTKGSGGDADTLTISHTTATEELGISSDGSASEFLNEQGNFVAISSDSSKADYSEGTWTPSYLHSDVTLTNESYTYIKTGKIVTLILEWSADSDSADINEEWRVLASSLPFTIASPNVERHLIGVNVENSLSIGATYSPFYVSGDNAGIVYEITHSNARLEWQEITVDNNVNRVEIQYIATS